MKFSMTECWNQTLMQMKMGFNNQGQNKRFDEINDKYLDDLGNETVKKRTKKQTIWARKVFRSKSEFI